MKVDESGIQRIASRRIWSRVLLGFKKKDLAIWNLFKVVWLWR